MAVIKPFKALKPYVDFASRVASVPYDVINRDEAFELAKNNEYSLLHVTRSEIGFDKSINPYSDNVYEKAQENLHELINKGALFIDEEDHFYLYQLVMGKQKQTGIVATFSVDDYLNNVIKKHEKTRKEKEEDRTKHILNTEAQTGPVFLTYRGLKTINDYVHKFKKNNQPLYDFTSEDGIKHTVWQIPYEDTDFIVNEIKFVRSLYIADGHHRAASAANAAKIRRNQFPNNGPDEEYNYFLGVLFPSEELKILPYNRVVLDLNGNQINEFFDKIKEHFNIEETKEKEPVEKKSISMYLDRKWYLLTPNSKVKKSDSVGENLDVGILQNYILKPILGIDDPRTNKRIDFVGGIRGTKELEKLVNSGKASVAFSMYPVSLDDLMEISDAGEIMPPKSTWFEPKLRDGLLIHLL